MTRRHLLVPVGVTAAIAAVPGVAVAAWLVSGIGSGTTTVAALAQPAGASSTAASPSTIDIGWTAPTPGSVQAQSTYVVTGGGTCSAPATASGCQVTGLTAATSHTFTVTPRLGASWTGPTAAVSASTTGVAVGTPDLQAASDSGASQTDNVTSIQTPTFTVAATTGATVQLFANGVATGPSVVASGGSASLMAGALAGGSGAVHSVTATATLSGSTATSDPLSITVDTQAPTAPSGVDATVPSNNQVSVAWTVVSGLTYQCNWDGAPTFAACTSPKSWGPGSAFNGLHTYGVRAVDPAGNTSDASTDTANA